MRFTVYQDQKRKSALTIIAVGVVLGLVYPVFSDGFSLLVPFINGLLIGFLGGLMVAIFELYVFNPQNRGSSFFTILFVKASVYTILITLLIMGVIGFTNSIIRKQDFLDYLAGPEYHHFLFKEDFHIIVIYTLVWVSLVIFTRQISRKMGQGILFNFISGKYHHPKEEMRVFMFLDLISSTTIAEKMGHIQFHYLLNDFFYDITPCILSTQGEIYRYVGDEVVVTWTMEHGLKDGNCIRTYFYASDQMKRLKEKYYRKYGLVPAFRAGFHYGKAIRGEIGEVKSQIVFHGDTLYTTGLIQKQCSLLGENILLSSELLQRIPLPIIYEAKSCGQVRLKGREKEVELFTISEVEVQTL